MKKRRSTPRSKTKKKKSPKAKTKLPPPIVKAKTVELFISYSHENAVWIDRLDPVLQFDHCRDKALAWNDQEMKAGDRWDKEIREALERMDVFVCLVSFEFLASGYIKEVPPNPP